MIKVFLADDHELVRTGLVRLLNDQDDIKVVGEAGSGEETVERLQVLEPDIVLMDVNMPGMGGLEATNKLLKINPALKLIVLTVHQGEPYPSRFLDAGVMGYVTKCCGVDTIIAAIRSVDKGQPYICEAVAHRLAVGKSASRRNLKSPFDCLSQRELQIALMLCQGIKIQDISDNLCLSPKTVSTYRHRVYHKLDVQSDVQLTHLALRYGIVEC